MQPSTFRFRIFFLLLLIRRSHLHWGRAFPLRGGSQHSLPSPRPSALEYLKHCLFFLLYVYAKVLIYPFIHVVPVYVLVAALSVAIADRKLLLTDDVFSYLELVIFQKKLHTMFSQVSSNQNSHPPFMALLMEPLSFKKIL